MGFAGWGGLGVLRWRIMAFFFLQGDFDASGLRLVVMLCPWAGSDDGGVCMGFYEHIN